MLCILRGCQEMELVPGLATWCLWGPRFGCGLFKPITCSYPGLGQAFLTSWCTLTLFLPRSFPFLEEDRAQGERPLSSAPAVLLQSGRQDHSLWRHQVSSVGWLCGGVSIPSSSFPPCSAPCCTQSHVATSHASVTNCLEQGSSGKEKREAENVV